MGGLYMKKTVSALVFFILACSAVSAAVSGGTNLPGGKYPAFAPHAAPVPPSGDERRSMDEYRRDVARYRREAHEYIEKAQNDIRRIQEAANDAIEKTNDVVNAYNREAKNSL